MIETLAELSVTDELTGLANRRYLLAKLGEEVRRSERSGSAFAMLMIDLDHFKEVNDRHGHQAGDECLHTLAEAINSHAKRTADLAARYGGEEFAVVLPNTNSKGALRVAKAIQREIRRLEIPHAASTVSEYVTLSYGVSSSGASLEVSLDSLIEAADKALYEAKNQGRDCIVQRNVEPPSA